MQSIIFIAPPAAGKGTQSKILSQYYHIPHISTGDLLREAALEENERGHYISTQMASGAFISDELMNTILKERLEREDCNGGYILDGYPRDVEQAISYEILLSQLNKELGDVILLDIDFETARKRTVGRETCSSCGAIYNNFITEMHSKENGICDKCGKQLFKRTDDNDSTFAVRYNTYLEKTAPLITYYEEKGALFVVDGTMDTNQITQAIKTILERKLSD